MKKILSFFSLVILLLPLVASAAITVSSPSGGELNQGADQNIIWSLDPANAAAKFNISLCIPPATAPICRSVKTNIGITMPPYTWKVNKLLSGSSYKIEVCRVDRSECGYSAAFAIFPPALRSQQEVLKLFKDAMGNRYADLNSNAKSGAQGVYDYIIGDGTYPPNGTIKGAKIATTTVNADKVYAKTVLERLDWFKAKFLTNAGNVLETKDKAGIKYAMNRRYSDICAAAWNTTIRDLTKTYNTAVANAEKARKGEKARIRAGTAANPQFPATGEQKCLADYNAGVKVINVTPNLYDSATKKFIAMQKLQNEKDRCLTTEYKKLYDAKEAVLSTFEGAMATPTTVYNNCVGNRISAWGSWQ